MAKLAHIIITQQFIYCTCKCFAGLTRFRFNQLLSPRKLSLCRIPMFRPQIYAQNNVTNTRYVFNKYVKHIIHNRLHLTEINGLLGYMQEHLRKKADEQQVADEVANAEQQVCVYTCVSDISNLFFINLFSFAGEESSGNSYHARENVIQGYSSSPQPYHQLIKYHQTDCSRWYLNAYVPLGL